MSSCQPSCCLIGQPFILHFIQDLCMLLSFQASFDNIEQLKLINLRSKTRNTPQRRHKKKIQGLAWVIGVVGGAGCSPNMGALGEHQMGQGSRRRWISVESHLDQYPSHQNGRWRWNLSTLGFRCHFWILMRPIRDIRGKQIFATIKQTTDNARVDTTCQDAAPARPSLYSVYNSVSCVCHTSTRCVHLCFPVSITRPSRTVTHWGDRSFKFSTALCAIYIDGFKFFFQTRKTTILFLLFLTK